mmetsp:Transcript_6349/g.11045  ORF Transcript_6349/g.11045 Transcript_6349/m.11045 type:complete len:230 (+) Transcript_6349:352-1041(+)
MPDIRLLTALYKDSSLSPAQRLWMSVDFARKLLKHYHVNLFKVSGYMALQVPHFLTYVWSVRRLAATNPALETGGALWFKNLAEADPTMILPIVSMGLTYYSLQRGVTPENRDWPINRLRSLFQMFLILTIPVTVQWPAAIFCYWGTSALYTIIQTTIIGLPSIQEKIVPGLKADLKAINENSLMPDECKRLANIIVTGEEGYIPTSEADVEADVRKYILEQNKLIKRK